MDNELTHSQSSLMVLLIISEGCVGASVGDARAPFFFHVKTTGDKSG